MSASVVTVETQRLRLRPWCDGDVDSWLRMNADPRVREFFNRPFDRNREERIAGDLRKRLERDGYGWWVLEAKGIAPFIGVIALQEVPFAARFTPAFEVGWRLTYEAQCRTCARSTSCSGSA
ncbi:MAG: GNAT family N-acetyltransferase [Candidatus Tyrphobacter sp.]